MSMLEQCARCGEPWKWDSDPVFDFNLPVGKRIWPAVCDACKRDLEGKYKSGAITYNELLMEFSNISARIAKRCADHPADVIRMIESMRSFTPRKRGK